MSAGRDDALPIPPAYLKAAALCALCLTAVLPLVEASAPEGKLGTLLLSTTFLFLIPFGIAASEEGHDDGIVGRLADSPLFSRGSFAAAAALGVLFFQRTQDAERAAGAFVMGVLWTQAFLHLESPLAYRIVVGACLALVVLGVAFRAALALALMPLSFTLLGLVLVIDLCIEHLRRHGVFDRIDLGWPLLAGGAIVTAALFAGSISFRLLEGALSPAPRRVASTRAGEALRPATVGEGSRKSTVRGETRLPSRPGSAPSSLREPAPRLSVTTAPSLTPETAERPDQPRAAATPREAPSPFTEPTRRAPAPAPEPSGSPSAEGTADPRATASAGAPGPGADVPSPGDWSAFSGGFEEAPPTWRERLRDVSEEIVGAILLLALIVAVRLSRDPGASGDEAEEARKPELAPVPGIRSLLGRVPQDPRARVIHLYNRVFEEGRTGGVSDDLSAEELAARLQRKLPDAEFHILLLVRSFEQARYSRQPIALEIADHAEEAARFIVKRLREARAA